MRTGRLGRERKVDPTKRADRPAFESGVALGEHFFGQEAAHSVGSMVLAFRGAGLAMREQFQMRSASLRAASREAAEAPKSSKHTQAVPLDQVSKDETTRSQSGRTCSRAMPRAMATRVHLFSTSTTSRKGTLAAARVVRGYRALAEMA